MAPILLSLLVSAAPVFAQNKATSTPAPPIAPAEFQIQGLGEETDVCPEALPQTARTDYSRIQEEAQKRIESRKSNSQQ